MGCVVKPGKIMFELSGVPLEVAKEAMRLASHKFSIKTKFIRGNKAFVNLGMDDLNES